MHTEVPQWLTQAYVRSLQAAGSTLPKEQLVAACASLVERWSSPDRLYHGLTHLVDILSHLEKLLPETHSPELVRLAAWYHGIVFSTAEKETYVRNGGEDEHSSAAVAQKELCELGIDDDSARRVAALIHAMGVREWERTATSTAHTATSTAQFEAIDLDEAALRDVHLTPLAAEPQRYRKYVELIRAEYAHIPDIDFFTARRSIVTRLLQRRRLFVTPLAREWEDSARQNLEAELERLNKRIRQLEAAEEAKGSTDAAPRTQSATTANSVPSPEPAASGPAATRGPAVATPQHARKAEEHSAGFQADTATASHSSPEFAAFGNGAEATGNNANPSEPRGAQNDESDGPGRASGSPKGNGSGVGGTKPSKQALDSLLRASAAEDEAEQAEQARRAQRMGSDSAMFTQASTEDPVSSLESCCDCIEDAKERPTNGNMTAEERKRKRREMISAQLRQRIEERHREAEEAKDARKHAETSAFPAVGTPGGTATEQRSSTGHSPAAAGKESMCRAEGAIASTGAGIERGVLGANGRAVSVQDRMGNSQDLADDAVLPGTVRHISAATPKWVDEDASPESSTSGEPSAPRESGASAELQEAGASRGSSAQHDKREIPGLLDDDATLPGDLPDCPEHGIEREPQI